MKSLITTVTVFIAIALFVLINANPIVDYTQGANGRAEYVHAVIHSADLNTGEDTSKNASMAKKVRALGKEGDDCGHIVANVLGGVMKYYNLFPQNASKNRGEWKSTVEAHTQLFLTKYNATNDYVDFVANLVYANSSATRPTGVIFTSTFYTGGSLAMFTDIPVSGSHRVVSNPYTGLIQNP